MTQLQARSLSLATLAAAILLSGCVTENKGLSSDSFMGRMRDRPAEKSEAKSGATARTRPDAPRPDVPDGGAGPAARRAAAAPELSNYPDSRVMVYQPKGDLLLVLVNESHSGRATEAGRVNLSLGEGNRAYKILTNGQMDALLKSLAAAGYDQNAADFVPGDEQYLNASATDMPRYQGVISVERGAMKTRVLGFRKASEGDALGLRRYQAYAVLKQLVQKWFGDSSRSEFPVGGVSVPAKGGK